MACHESLFGTLEAELLSREHFAAHEQARQHTHSNFERSSFLEGW
jgi:putative transposase